MSKRLEKPYSSLTRIRDIYLKTTVNQPPFEGGEAEKWLYVIERFLSETGHEVVTPELRAQEERVLELGLCTQYFRALIDVVQPDFRATNSEEAGAFLLITASPEERAEAVELVLKGAL